jgi:hypothetical protein
VERVQRWRRAHPQYWRKKQDRQYRPLQDVIDTQVIESKGNFGDIDKALQDLMVTVTRQRLERQAGYPSPRSGVGRVDQTAAKSCR